MDPGRHLSWDDGQRLPCHILSSLLPPLQVGGGGKFGNGVGLGLRERLECDESWQSLRKRRSRGRQLFTVIGDTRGEPIISKWTVYGRVVRVHATVVAETIIKKTSDDDEGENRRREGVLSISCQESVTISLLRRGVEHGLPC